MPNYLNDTQIQLLEILDKGFIVYINQNIAQIDNNACKLLKIKESDAIGKSHLAQIVKVIREDGSEFTKDDKIIDHEKVILGLLINDTHPTWIEFENVSLISNDSNVTVYLLSEVTKLKNLQSEIDMFKEAISSVSYGVKIAKGDGKILFTNSAAEITTNEKSVNMLGKKLGELELEKGFLDKKDYDKMWETLGINKKAFETEVSFMDISNEQHTYLMHTTPVLNTKKGIGYYVSTETDITPYKNIENVKNLLETFFDASIDMLCIANTGGRFTKISKSFERVLGWAESELLSKSILEYVHKEDLEETYNMLGELFIGKPIVNFQNRYKCKDGEYKWLSWNLRPLDQGEIFGTARDVTEEKHVDRMKTEFISIASHQLRTPLSAIRWHTEMLTSHIFNNLELKDQKYLRKIENSTLRMIQLVGTFLNISRIGSGRLIVEPVETDLEEVLNSIYEELILKLSAKQQEIVTNYNSKKKTYLLDTNITRNILLNLLTNAIKYSGNNKKIEVTIEDKDNNLIIIVKDQGFGIPLDEQDKVFSKFFRSSNIATQETDGTGLGLFLVNELIEITGGNVEFESIEGQGTTFTITYPNTGMVEKVGEVTLGL